MKVSNQGFTLIELVVVITIIGILAAVAAPRFINVQTDARISVLGGVEASMRSAASLVYAKALIQGLEGAANAAAADNLDINNDGTDDTAVQFGYPAVAEITGQLDIASADLVLDAANGVVGYDLDGDAAADATCRVTYAASTGAGVVPAVTPATAGC